MKGSAQQLLRQVGCPGNAKIAEMPQRFLTGPQFERHDRNRCQTLRHFHRDRPAHMVDAGNSRNSYAARATGRITDAASHAGTGSAERFARRYDVPGRRPPCHPGAAECADPIPLAINPLTRVVVEFSVDNASNGVRLT